MTPEEAVENQRRINEMADEAEAMPGKSLKERLARMTLAWASETEYLPNPAAVAPRYARDRKTQAGDPIIEWPEVPSVEDGRHYVGEQFCPAPPGIAVNEHWRVIDEWVDEERLSEALHAGGAFLAVLEAAREMSARRVLQTMTKVAEEMAEMGSQLLIGPGKGKNAAVQEGAQESGAGGAGEGPGGADPG